MTEFTVIPEDYEEEQACNHEGWVLYDRCERCGETGLKTDYEIYEEENPR